MCGPSEHAQPPILLSTTSECKSKNGCVEGLNDKRDTASHEMQTCMPPRELIWEGEAPPQEMV